MELYTFCFNFPAPREAYIFISQNFEITEFCGIAMFLNGQSLYVNFRNCNIYLLRIQLELLRIYPFAMLMMRHEDPSLTVTKESN